MPRRTWWSLGARGGLGGAAVAALAAAGCAVNPATGQRQLALVGESAEIELGRQADREIAATMGLYADERLGPFVAEVGGHLAALSERPDLPWTFRILDDPAVNAFALPGGSIYITRGILAHLASAAEAASVLAHEVGHVTARHSVDQLSKQQLLGLGLGVGMAVSPEVARFGRLVEAGLGLLFLKYSRDDERQADELGMRYLVRARYDPREMSKVFATLERVSAAAGERVPGWLSTHPDPGERGERLARAAAAAGAVPEGAIVGADAYLGRLQGLVFGADPRQGYFQPGGRFSHPELKFQLTFPGGWKTANEPRRTVAVAPGEDALLELALAQEPVPDAATQGFLSREGIEAVRTWRRNVNGLEAVWATFKVPSESQPLAGRVAHVALGGRVFRLLGIGLAQTWVKYEAAAERTFDSFQRLADPAALAVVPARLELVRLAEELTFEQLLERYPSTVEERQVALLNRLAAGQRLPAGAWFKRVVGGVGALAPAGPPAETGGSR